MSIQSQNRSNFLFEKVDRQRQTSSAKNGALESFNLPDGANTQVVVTGSCEGGQIHFRYKMRGEFQAASFLIEELSSSDHYLVQFSEVRAAAIRTLGRACKVVTPTEMSSILQHLIEFEDSECVAKAVQHLCIKSHEVDLRQVRNTCAAVIERALERRKASAASIAAVKILYTYLSPGSADCFIRLLSKSLAKNEPLSSVEVDLLGLLVAKADERIVSFLKKLALKRPIQRPNIADLVDREFFSVRLSVAIGVFIGALSATFMMTLGEIDVLSLMSLFLLPTLLGFVGGLLLLVVELVSQYQALSSRAVDPVVRSYAMCLLKQLLPAEEADELLLAVLKREDSFSVIAAEMLRNPTSAKVLNKLYSLASVGSHLQRSLAMEALHGKVTPEASAIIRRGMADNRSNVKRAAADLQKAMMSKALQDMP